MKAIGKNIVIEKIEEKITTESGILLSDDDAKSFRYQKGRVIMPAAVEKSSVSVTSTNRSKFRFQWSSERGLSVGT